MDKYILAVDQGTTSSRAIIFDSAGQQVSTAQQEFQQVYPQAGWVEHNPIEIWNSVTNTVRQVLKQAQLKISAIAAVGITNQRETSVVWNKATGEPIYNAIVWQDRRTAGSIDDLKVHQEHVQSRTGLVLDAYFSASKLRWILDHVPGAKELADRQQLCFGTIDSWLIYQMTAGQRHVTDESNASRTLLFNLHKRDWDPEMLALFNLPDTLLPQIVPSSGIIGYWQFGNHSLPIAGVAGDQQAATFGQLALNPGTAKNTYGTGCFLVVPTGTQPVLSKHKLLSTIAWSFADSLAYYALEGSLFTTGAAISWLKDGLGVITDDAEVNTLAATVADSDGVVFVPALAGLGAPHWDQYARGTILGLTRRTTKAHLARATLEGIALQVMDIVTAATKDLGSPLTALQVDGGAAKSDLLLQLQADILNIPVIRPATTELTAKGAAFLAGLAVGYWKDIQELESLPNPTYSFEPQMQSSLRSALIDRWERGVKKSGNWAN